MNASGKGLVALYLHRRGEQWLWQSVVEQVGKRVGTSESVQEVGTMNAKEKGW